MTSPILTVERNDSLLEGEVEIYIVDWSNEGTPSASDTDVFIKGESSSIKTAVFLSGDESITGSLVTLPPLTVRSSDGGKIYRIVNQATMGSRTRKVVFEVPIEKPQGET